MVVTHSTNVSNQRGEVMARRVIYLLAAPLAVVVAIASWNYVGVQKQVSQVIKADLRNSGINAIAHYQWFVNPQTVVYDLRGVSEDKSALDVTRTLLQFSEQMKARSFDRVILSYKGNPRFMLKGNYFHTLGTEYGVQNPMYTLRTLPENIYNLDGSPAFGTWTGGALGVLGKQMEDLTEFNKRWYLSDVTGGN